jgi:hypothetical protein
MMRKREIFVVGIALAGVTSGCSNKQSQPGAVDAPVTIDSPEGIDAPSLKPACKAQRLVHLVGANGGLAWFTLAWPIPSLIQNFNTSFAYDDPAKATAQGNDAAHPLFARNNLWANRGTSPFPTVFIAGTNETHTNQPASNDVSNNIGLDAAATVVQAPFASTFPAIVVGNVGPFGTATGAATPTAVADANALIDLLVGAGVATDAEIRPTATQLGRYVPAGATAVEIALATELATAANAAKFNLVSDLVLPAFDDDPHNGFTGGAETARADNLAQMLDAFYADLQIVDEPTCGKSDGSAISFADNTVLYVTGDTPKSFQLTGGTWNDGTINNTNQVFLRSNGFIKPGWFGVIDVVATTHTNFDAATGAPSTLGNDDPTDTAAGWASTLYAITRGDATKVATFTSAVFDGEKH